MASYSSKDAIIANGQNTDAVQNIRDLAIKNYRAIQIAEEYTPADSSAEAWAGTAPTTQDGALDKLAAFSGVEQTVLITWDQSDQGAITTTGVDLGVDIPANALVTKVVFDKLVAITGTPGDVKLRVNSTDLSAAMDTPGTIGVDDASLAAKDATGGDLELYSATNPSTAGKVNILVSYVISA